MSTEQIPAALKQETAPVKTDPEQSSPPLSPSKREQAFSVKEEENDNDDADADSEEDFLQTIEKEEAQKEYTAEHHQSKDAKDAPRLLQDALKKGDVKPDDSEEEEEKKDAKEGIGNGNRDLKEKLAREKQSVSLSFRYIRHTVVAEQCYKYYIHVLLLELRIVHNIMEWHCSRISPNSCVVCFANSPQPISIKT